LTLQFSWERVFFIRNSDWWTPITLFSGNTRVENIRNFHVLFSAEPISPDERGWDYSKDLKNLLESYEFEGRTKDIQAFLDETWTTGLVIARGERLLFEEYFKAYDEHSLVTSFSLAKSVISSLIGIAIDQGYIASVEDRGNTYLPEFSGTAYGAVSISLPCHPG